MRGGGGAGGEGRRERGRKKESKEGLGQGMDHFHSYYIVQVERTARNRKSLEKMKFSSEGIE